jgi:hypothetical protein
LRVVRAVAFDVEDELTFMVNRYLACFIVLGKNCQRVDLYVPQCSSLGCSQAGVFLEALIAKATKSVPCSFFARDFIGVDCAGRKASLKWFPGVTPVRTCGNHWIDWVLRVDCYRDKLAIENLNFKRGFIVAVLVFHSQSDLLRTPVLIDRCLDCDLSCRAGN